jgi:8-oxo-dGTP diphosphatase
MRRFGERLVKGAPYRRRRGIYAVIHHGAHVLITEEMGPTREFQLPGGGIDPGEHPIRALHREIAEETGWTVAVRRRLGNYTRFCYMPDYDLWAQKVCEIWLCRAIAPRGQPGESHHRAVWCDVPEALDLLAGEGDRYFLRKWIGLSEKRNWRNLR